MVTNGLPSYFEHINLMRAWAAVTVLVYHVIQHMEWQSFREFWPLMWFVKGWMGVDIFFVLSGFVITFVLGKAYAKGAPYARSYVRHRAARILPLHWLTCVFFVVAAKPEWIGHAQFWEVFLAHLFMLHATRAEWLGAINGPNWSVAIEVQFYLLMLFIIPWVMRASYVAVWLVLVGISWAYKGFYFWHHESGSIEIFYFLQLLPMLDVFVWGILLAKWVLSGERAVAQMRQEATRKKVLWATLMLTTMVLSAFWLTDDALSKPLMGMVGRHMLALACAGWLWLAVAHSTGQAVRALPHKVGSYLGEISYGLYLWHIPVLLLWKQAGVENAPLMLALCFAGSAVLASASWHWFERPIMRWLR